MRFGPFLGLAVLLAILWASSFLVFHVVGFFIHILLILAVISLLVHFFSGSSKAA
jgi:mannose/fructose/N-acetylgalactosamine-specific phosphotransferase system component IIC